MDQLPINTPPWLDKSLWLVVLAPLFLFINSKFGTNLQASEVAGLVLPIVAYILGNKWKTAVLQKAAMAGASAGAAVATEGDAVNALRK